MNETVLETKRLSNRNSHIGKDGRKMDLERKYVIEALDAVEEWLMTQPIGGTLITVIELDSIE